MIIIIIKSLIRNGEETKERHFFAAASVARAAAAVRNRTVRKSIRLIVPHSDLFNNVLNHMRFDKYYLPRTYKCVGQHYNGIKWKWQVFQ